MSEIRSLERFRLSERLMFSTVRIECTFSDEKRVRGTGFLFDFFRDTQGNNVPVLVCNRHVIENSIHGEFVFNRADDEGKLIYGQPTPCSFDKFNKLWIFHPDPEIDLAIMPMDGLFAHLRALGKRVYYASISSSTIPKNEEWEKFIVLEDILVIGYPNALMDKVNNLPIFRKGTTASHPNIRYEGRDEFLVDVGVYPGSSGSPVFLLNEDFYKKSRELEEGADKGRLLGIIYSGHVFTAQGLVNEIEPETKNVIASDQVALS